ncbi:AAA family ATPase [Actinopolymorpha sp. B17G11]|uniref:ATP-binding protein n=1 Tax=Actinopolymorpha sp. B17G11 TaxID=3160861 RepID=UPI0032E46D11
MAVYAPDSRAYGGKRCRPAGGRAWRVRAVVSTRLRGRDEERVLIREWLLRVADGRGSVLVVEGPAGIGKTRLLAEASQFANESGFTVASGRADQLGGMAPLAVLLDAFRGSDPPLVTATDLNALSGLADQRFWLLDRLRALLEKRAGQRPLLVTVDDLQWADAATLWAIGSLATQLTAVSVGWALTHRHGTVGPELGTLLAKLDSIKPTVLRLRPLPADASVALATDLLGHASDHALLDLVRRAEGNPFFVVEAVRATTECEDETAVGTFRPDSCCAARLAGLDTAARRLLQVGAVFGRSFALRDVAALLGQPAAALMVETREVLDAGVVVEEGDRLAFAHDLLWQAVYDDLPIAAREVLHRDAARALLASGAPPLEAAGHLLESARPGDTEAIDMLLRAARDAAARAPATAADLYTHTLALLSQTAPQRTGVIVEAVSTLAQSGRLDQSREIADGALRTGVDPASEGAIRYTLSLGQGLRGQYKAALTQCRLGLDRTGVPEPTRALLHAMESLDLAFLGEVAPAIETARAAVSASEQIADCTAAPSLGLSAEAIAQRFAGSFTKALALIEQAVRRADLHTPAARFPQPRRWHGWMVTVLDRFDEADIALLRSRQEMDALGLGFLLHLWHAYRAGLRLAAGRLHDAVAEAEAAVAVADELQTAALLPTANAILARVAVARGDLAGGLQHLARCPAHVSNVFGLELAYAWGLVADAAGDHQAALEHLAPIWAAFSHHFGILAFTPSAAPHLVRIALTAGDRDRAALATDAATRLAALNPDIPSIAGAATQAEGLLHDDIDLLVKAAEQFAESPRPLAHATAHEDTGAAVAAHGNRDDAIHHLDQALVLYDAADATRDTDRVRARLRTLGLRRRRFTPTRPTTGWSALSGSELGVARLVAAGLTNKAVADQLYLSRHTVDSHLRHIFTKLDINTRVELTRLVLQHEPAPTADES